MSEEACSSCGLSGLTLNLGTCWRCHEAKKNQEYIDEQIAERLMPIIQDMTVEQAKQAERRELFKQVALAIISDNYHHSDWLKGADWINPVVENILIAAETFSKKDSHE